ncbi:MAG: NUDIX hydrolase [Chloroflexi bacterium]|nr:MAG: NUDIX hydrolase [Chloroflexota bacterium]
MSGNYIPPLAERPSVTVDVVIFSLVEEDLRVLLVRRKYDPFAGMWAIPGGFVHPNESLEQAALRELEEETGVTDVYIEQLYTFGDPDRDPRMRVITVAYFALVPYDAIQHRPGDDAAETGWFSVFNLPPLAFDHKEIVEYALTRLRYKLEYSAVGFRLLPDVFTLSELQQAYEIILGEKLDKRNFRRKILSSGILEETGKRKKEGEGRPAMLYRYRDDAIAEVKTRRLFP